MSSERTQKSYDQDFKLKAVQLSCEPRASIAQTARSLGIPLKTLYRWRHEMAVRREGRAFPGKGNPSEPESEVERLQRENARLRMERDILKKATAFFANESR